MKLTSNKLIVGAFASLACIAAIPAATAQSALPRQPNWENPFDNPWKDPFGNCIRTTGWDDGGTIGPECGGAVAATRTPAAPEAPEPKMMRKTLSADTFFDFDRATLKPEGKAELDRLAANLRTADKVNYVSVVGHTDSIGSESYNLDLSRKRAESVKGYLVSKGLSASVIQTKGMGEAQPIAPNRTEAGRDNPSGRAQNRRVEIAVEAVETASK